MDQKTKQHSKLADSKNLSRAYAADPAMEKLAEHVIETFAIYCAKLKELKPEIEKIRAWFKDNNGSKTLAACRSFKEFCEKKLNRKEQTVYAMLGEYSAKKKASIAEDDKSTPKQQPRSGELVLSSEDQERLRTGCNAAVRFFEAVEKGDHVRADEAKREFFAISKAEPLKPVIFGDQPNCKMLLIDLLADIEKVGEKLPVALTRKCEAIRKRLGIDDKSFELQPQERNSPHSQQQQSFPKPSPADNAEPTATTEDDKTTTVKSKGTSDGLARIINGLHIIRRKDRKYVLLDPTKTENNTLAICDEIAQAVAAAERKKPEQVQSAQADSVTA